MAYTITKKGRNPAVNPTAGTMIKDSVSEKMWFEKYKMLINTTNNIFGIKEEIVRPYNEEINDCLLVTGTASILIFRIKIAETKPIVKVQNRMLMTLFIADEAINCVIDCNQ